MNGKKRYILENGMRLFSEKGFHNTTIQEITAESGISKGAFYLHFDSKEDLILNIFVYYYKNIMDKVKSAQNENLGPMDSFARQIQYLFDSFWENKTFILMHIHDNVSLFDKVDEFIQHIKEENFKWNSENLLAIYGEQLEPSIVDASTLVDGIIHGYMKWIFIDELDIDITKLSQFIIRRIDDCVQGVMDEGDAPMIELKQITELFPTNYKLGNKSIRRSLENMKTIIDQIDIDDKRRKDLHIAIDLLLQEEEKEKSQTVIFRGMLTQFNDIPEMKEDCKTISKQLDKQQDQIEKELVAEESELEKRGIVT